MGRTSKKCIALAVVLILHALVVAVLAGLSRYRLVLTANHPIEVVFLSRNHIAERPTAPTFDGGLRARLPTAQPPALILPVLPQMDGDGRAAVDWSAEAARQANSSAAAIASAAKANPSADPQGRSDWFPRPLHFKGEEIPGAGGDTMVFINDHCYQITSVFRSVPNASNNGMGLQTYCLGESNEPRGDLFKDLEAYKKRHPER